MPETQEMPSPDFAAELSGGAGDSGDWTGVADKEMDSQKHLHDQILDAEQDADVSDGDGGSTSDDVFDRVRRFKAARAFDDGCPLNDPFWISPFNEALESIEEKTVHSDGIKKQLDREIHLLSGCTGMCAEGWVCKAGFPKMKSANT